MRPAQRNICDLYGGTHKAGEVCFSNIVSSLVGTLYIAKALGFKALTRFPRTSLKITTLSEVPCNF